MFLAANAVIAYSSSSKHQGAVRVDIYSLEAGTVGSTLGVAGQSLVASTWYYPSQEEGSFWGQIQFQASGIYLGKD